MGEIVAAVGMSHAPPLTADPQSPPKAQLATIHDSLRQLRDLLERSKPDLILAVIDDHFENFFGDFMPSFAISIADSNYGPPDHYLEWLKLDQHEVPNNASFALDLLAHARASGFDVVQSGRLAYGHALMVPLHFLRPELDVPVVPIFTNVFTPPLASAARCYDLGVAVRELIERRPERVAILATGALSHWPPYWKPSDPEDDKFLQRMRKFQTEGLRVIEEDPNLFTDLGLREIEMAQSGMPLVNPEWDQRMMTAFSEGDVELIRGLTYEEVEREGGNGGHEILNWVIMMGALNGAPMKAYSYDDCAEWMCGIGFVGWEAISAIAVAA